MTVTRHEPGTFDGQIFFTFDGPNRGGVEIADATLAAPSYRAFKYPRSSLTSTTAFG
jgi:hypothetical protein